MVLLLIRLLCQGKYRHRKVPPSPRFKVDKKCPWNVSLIISLVEEDILTVATLLISQK